MIKHIRVGLGGAIVSICLGGIISHGIGVPFHDTQIEYIVAAVGLLCGLGFAAWAYD